MSHSDTIIRTAQASDHEACEALVRDPFWDLYRPGCVEHLILHNARGPVRDPDPGPR